MSSVWRPGTCGKAGTVDADGGALQHPIDIDHRRRQAGELARRQFVGVERRRLLEGVEISGDLVKRRPVDGQLVLATIDRVHRRLGRGVDLVS